MKMYFLDCFALRFACICLLFRAVISISCEIWLSKSNSPNDVDVGTMGLIDTTSLQRFAPTVQHRKLWIYLLHPAECQN